MSSKVYFMNDRANNIGESTPYKAVKLLRDAGIKTLFKPGDTVGIKVHMGTDGNSLNLRPHWIKSIVDEVKRLGGKPVVVDTNCLHMGFGAQRCDTETNLIGVNRHGFNEQTLGCPVIVAVEDDHTGHKGPKAAIPHGVYLKYTYVAEHMTKFDAIIVVTHFKGHPMGVFGGALKNVGIGMASTLGKLNAHLYNHPEYGLKNASINEEAYDGLVQMFPAEVNAMLTNCPFDAYEMKDGRMIRHSERCRQCSGCFFFGVLYNLLVLKNKEGMMLGWPMGIVDSAAGIINYLGKDKFLYLNYAFDITPACDCANWHDRPMVPNIGTFCSKDPVAVDIACLEATEEVAAVPGSSADEFGLAAPQTERFTNCASMAKVSQWAQINAAVYNGLGSSEYMLVQSEPLDSDLVDHWISPYSPQNPYGYVNREILRNVDWDTTDMAYAEPQLGLPDLHKKPNGKLGECSLKDCE